MRSPEIQGPAEAGTRPSRRSWRELGLHWPPRWCRVLLPSRLPVALATRLGVETEALAGLSKVLEKQFLEMGAVLEKLPAASAVMVEKGERLFAVRDGAQGARDPTEGTVHFLGQATEYLDHFQVRIDHVAQQLRGVVGRIDELLRTEEELRRTVAPMKYVRTLLKIELARLDANLQSTFVTLADEIEAMEGKLGQTFETRFGALGAKREIAAGLLDQLQAQIASQGESFGRLKQKIERGVEQLRQDAARDSSENARLAGISRAIAAQVSQLVVGLQAQDIISQKLAHVIEALGCLRKQVAAADLHGSRHRRELTRTLRGVSQLEAAQLEVIGQDVRRTERVLGEALDRVSQQACGLEEECQTLLTPAQAGAEATAVQGLLTTSQEVRALLATTVERAAQACDGFRPISQEASTVTATIRDISIQMRLIALNMQVQAALCGGRTGLEIIAGQTAAIAAQTDQLGERVASELDLLSSGLGQMLGACETLRAEGQAQQEQLATSGLEREGALIAMRDQGLAGLCAAGSEVRALTQAMRQQLKLETLVGGGIERARKVLFEVLAWSEGAAGAGNEAEAACALAAVGHRYTMESERAVHARVMQGQGQSDVPASAPALPTSAAPATRGMPELANAGPVNSTPAALGDNVELF